MGNVKDIELENTRNTGNIGNIKNMNLEMEKYHENWKYGKFEKCEIGNMEYVKNDEL